MKKFRIPLLSLLTFVALLFVAVQIAQWQESLRQQASIDFIITPRLFIGYMGNLLLAGLAAGWLWLVYPKLANRSWTALALCLLGLGILLYNTVRLALFPNASLPALSEFAPSAIPTFICSLAFFVGLFKWLKKP
ncbi:MAG TPA: hypothetical protein PK299_03315 [Anaerolineales bacterium]|nr:hypothetical protein [Anaerolineales bacterium]